MDILWVNKMRLKRTCEQSKLANRGGTQREPFLMLMFSLNSHDMPIGDKGLVCHTWSTVKSRAVYIRDAQLLMYRYNYSCIGANKHLLSCSHVFHYIQQLCGYPVAFGDVDGTLIENDW